jgi:hypothetical protein
MIEDFDRLVKQRNALKSWKALGLEFDYSHTHFQLRMDVVKPSMVAYCGQRSQGTANYHDAPDFFVEAVRAEIKRREVEIVEAAYNTEMQRLNKEIAAQKQNVLKQLEAADD